MKSKAYLIEPLQTNFDLTELHQQYDVRYIFASVGQRPNIYNPDEFLRVVREWARGHFDPSKDMLVMTGKMLSLSLTLLALGWEFDEIQLLIFDGNSGGYLRKEIHCLTHGGVLSHGK